ncbi:MAG: pyruvate dehydrogenase complex dihydrolipoamide acetyltransferase [Bacteroidetes bacterium B1(2017)]|nr:MAG: pyruvate dehydrogenase complex dihydrolipoamide acetyltransferase [Bacteroidetes bacterium B1(2017)]
MAEVINMPKMSDTMTEGVIVSWLKKVGDDIKPGDILAEVETDKATMELENYVKGTLLHIGIPEGGSVPVDALIAIVGQKGEDFSALLNGAPKAASVETPKAEVVVESAAPVAAEAPISTDDSRVKASPLAKSVAKEKGIDLSLIAGSGDNGRIVKKDVENFVPSSASSAPAKANTIALPQIVAQESYTEVAVSQMRKVIARRLSESKHTAPHFYLTMSINMDKTIAARKQMNEFSEVKISVNDIIVKAVALSLRKNPNANSSWLGDKIRYNHHINIGVAVAIEDGLIVPVVKFADNKSIAHISAEVKQLAEKAKTKKLQPTEFEGNTFTISNLGMFGIDEFTAIINPPDACILAVGAAKETVIAENGAMKIAQVMKVTLSCDHRVVDGAVGSAFLQTLKDLLENPVKMLV